MKILFQFIGKTKRRWKYRAYSIDDGRCTAIESKHIQLCIYKDILGKEPPRELIAEIQHRPMSETLTE